MFIYLYDIKYKNARNYEFNIKIVNLHLFSLFPCAEKILLAPLSVLGLAAKIP